MSGARPRTTDSHTTEPPGSARACTAPELCAGAMTCGLVRWKVWGKIAVRVCPPAVAEHDSRLRLAGPVWLQPGVQGRGDHAPPSRGQRAATSGRPSGAGPGRSGSTGGDGRAACPATRWPARHAGDSAGLTLPSYQALVDLSRAARPPGGQQADRRSGATVGGRKPRRGYRRVPGELTRLATRSAKRPSGGSSARGAAGPLHAAWTPPGARSCVPRPRACQRVISFPWTPSSSSVCMCCSSYRWRPGGCTSPTRPPCVQDRFVK